MSAPTVAEDQLAPDNQRPSALDDPNNPPADAGSEQRGQAGPDTHSSSAALAVDDGGQDVRDAQRPPAPVVDPHLCAFISFTAQQVLGLERERIAQENRLRAAETQGLEPEYLSLLAKPLADLRAAEKAARSQLRKYARKLPIADWIAGTRGIALDGVGLFLGALGAEPVRGADGEPVLNEKQQPVVHHMRSLSDFGTVSKLWRYCGLDVRPDGRAPRKVKGQRDLGFSPTARAICIGRIGTGIVTTLNGPYRVVYEDAKAKYVHELKYADWTPKHRDNAARRVAVKAFLRDLWVEWRDSTRGCVATEENAA